MLVCSIEANIKHFVSIISLPQKVIIDEFSLDYDD